MLIGGNVDQRIFTVLFIPEMRQAELALEVLFLTQYCIQIVFKFHRIDWALFRFFFFREINRLRMITRSNGSSLWLYHDQFWLGVIPFGLDAQLQQF